MELFKDACLLANAHQKIIHLSLVMEMEGLLNHLRIHPYCLDFGKRRLPLLWV